MQNISGRGQALLNELLNGGSVSFSDISLIAEKYCCDKLLDAGVGQLVAWAGRRYPRVVLIVDHKLLCCRIGDGEQCNLKWVKPLNSVCAAERLPKQALAQGHSCVIQCDEIDRDSGQQFMEVLCFPREHEMDRFVKDLGVARKAAHDARKASAAARADATPVLARQDAVTPRREESKWAGGETPPPVYELGAAWPPLETAGRAPSANLIGGDWDYNPSAAPAPTAAPAWDPFGVQAPPQQPAQDPFAVTALAPLSPAPAAAFAAPAYASPVAYAPVQPATAAWDPFGMGGVVQQQPQYAPPQPQYAPPQPQYAQQQPQYAPPQPQYAQQQPQYAQQQPLYAPVSDFLASNPGSPANGQWPQQPQQPQPQQQWQRPLQPQQQQQQWQPQPQQQQQQWQQQPQWHPQQQQQQNFATGAQSMNRPKLGEQQKRPADPFANLMG